MTTDNNDCSTSRSTLKKLLSTIPFFFVMMPMNPHRVRLGTSVPEGLALVCSLPTAAEADLVRQVLQDAGFHPEYVSSAIPAITGAAGSPLVCVPCDEAEEARCFLADFLAGSAEETQV